jgi:hypothetical protein
MSYLASSLPGMSNAHEASASYRAAAEARTGIHSAHCLPTSSPTTTLRLRDPGQPRSSGRTLLAEVRDLGSLKALCGTVITLM